MLGVWARRSGQRPRRRRGTGLPAAVQFRPAPALTAFESLRTTNKSFRYSQLPVTRFSNKWGWRSPLVFPVAASQLATSSVKVWGGNPL